MAYTQADVDALDRMMLEGLQEVRFEDGRLYRRQPQDQMMALRKVAAAEVRMTATAASGLNRRRFSKFSKGT
jgi:hypothetical protein